MRPHLRLLPLPTHDEIISKSCQRHGRDYLSNNVINVSQGPKEKRILITGLHTVCDIYCNDCHSVLEIRAGIRGEPKIQRGPKYIVEKLKMLNDDEGGGI